MRDQSRRARRRRALCAARTRQGRAKLRSARRGTEPAHATRRRSCLALVTDFGLQDHYVGVLHAVAEREAPRIPRIDLAHELPPFSIPSAAYTIAAAWEWVPRPGVVCAVVDPGVGSMRRELIVEEGERILVAPDNGVADLLLRRYSDALCYRAAEWVLRQLEERKPAYSQTFDGRDLFVPLACRIARFGIWRYRGESVEEPALGAASGVRVDLARGLAEAPVVHIDRFGNLITALHRDDIPQGNVSSVATDKQRTVRPVRTFSDVAPGQLLAYWGSSGYLEIACREGSARDETGLKTGTTVVARL